ncbi:MAG: dihydropteroate synthase [Actinomycetota bacterium]
MSGRTLVMGVVNVTPDSFSDGGRWLAPESALAHAHRLLGEGADILDVGGESTRPGAHRVDAATECDRILGIVRDLAAEGHAVSVDTVNAVTAHAAIAAGATMVNDVSGSLADPDMGRVIAEAGVRYVVQHWRGTPETMAGLATYGDVVAEVIAELRQRLDELLAMGVRPEQVILDPGLGFAKDAGHNWRILAHLERFEALGFPLLVGASRKRFLAGVVPPELAHLPVERDHATAAVTALLARRRVWGVRVHDVRPSRDAVRVAEAWIEGAGDG